MNIYFKMKFLPPMLLSILLLVNGKSIQQQINLIQDNCDVLNPDFSTNYNLSCIGCELGVSILNYENQLNNINQTLNVMKQVCNSTFIQQYQNLSQECNIIYHNVPLILKQLDVNLTATQICSKLYLC
jgi:hypothetical protein